MDHSAKAKSRVAWQYRNAEKFLAWIDTLPSIAQGEIELPLQQIADLLDFDADNEADLELDDGSLLEFEDGSTLELGEKKVRGHMLDIVGRIIGQKRVGVTIDNDRLYRIILRARVSKNTSDATIDSTIVAIKQALETEQLQLVDYQNMSFLVRFFEPVDQQVIQLLRSPGLIPKPQGVGIAGLVVPTEAPYFGVDGINEDPAPDTAGLAELNYSGGGSLAELYGV